MPDELEPIELEPIDLEPADDWPAPARERRPTRSRRRTWGGLALAGIGLAAWAAIAATTRSARTGPAPVTPTTAARVDRVDTVAPALRAGLRGVGSGRFAAVIDDRLYLVDATTPGVGKAGVTLVRLPEGHATIAEQSGESLLASTFEQTLVATAPETTRTLSAQDSAIPAIEPGRWWLLRNDGTVRDDRNGRPVRVPAGMRVVAAVPGGFVGIAAPGFTWEVWSGSATRTIAATGFQFLARGPHTLVFKFGCVYSGCGLEILDLRDGSAVTTRLSIVPEFAEYSPDGTRLALASTLGDVYILDATSAGVMAQTTALTSPSASSPLAWTPDGALLIVRPDTLVVWRGSPGGPTTKAIGGTLGLEQIVALP